MGQAKRRAAEINELKLQGPRRKELGQVFTPFPLVKEMLEKLPMWNEPAKNIKWKTVLEPACGNGQFVLGVIRKLMDKYQKAKTFKTDQLAFIHIMQNQLFAVELDEEMRQECISRVKEMGRAYGVEEIFLDKLNHNIIQGNALELDLGRCFIDNMENWESPFIVGDYWQVIGMIAYKKPGIVIDGMQNPQISLKRITDFVKSQSV